MKHSGVKHISTTFSTVANGLCYGEVRKLPTNFNHMQYTRVLHATIVVAMVFAMSLIAGVSVASAEGHRSHDGRDVRSERAERDSTRSMREYLCVHDVRDTDCAKKPAAQEE